MVENTESLPLVGVAAPPAPTVIVYEVPRETDNDEVL
jgi:hypothetical protein